MAKPAHILTLNLGMQTVSMARFELLPSGGLKLTGFAESELILDPAADATRPEQLKTVVRELRDALAPKSYPPIYACLPSQAVFSRFVQLPGESAEDVEAIIPFEAQQNVPFPIDEVVWDHQIMGKKHGEFWDIGLVAIKADQLTELVDAIKAGGLRVGAMDVAPMALYNALRYNQPDLPGCTLLIDIGARSTNLVFSENGRVFCRSIPIAGHTATAAIAKEFDQDLVLAEKLKVEKGQVGLGGAYAEPSDPTEARIAKVVRNTMTRLHAEISRSINFYRTNHGGSLPDRVFLAGGAVQLGYTTEFFSEKLKAPVEFFNPLHNVEIQPGAIPDEKASCGSGIGELVGLALRSIKDCPVELNLTPPSVVQAMDFRRRIPALVLAAVFLILAPALWLGYFTLHEQSLRSKVEELTTKKTTLSTASANIKNALEMHTKLAASAVPYLTAVAERTAWPDIIEELAASIPQRFIWITKITPIDGSPQEAATAAAVVAPQRPGERRAPAAAPATQKTAIVALQVDGLYLDSPPNAKAARIVDEFVDNFNESGIFDTKGDRTQIITQRTTPDGETWAYGFTLRLPLKAPIPIQ